MAPNRKSSVDLTATLSSNDLASLQNTIQPKFLPLTHPSEQQQSQTEAKAQGTESQSYWDWSAPVEEEKVVNLFSVSNIESNLIQAAAGSNSSEESQQVSEHDDYWTEQSVEKKVVTTAQPQHILNNYWQWAADQDSKQATISNILAEERAVRIVSAASTQTREVSAPKAVESHVHATKACNDSYWGWTSPVVASYTDDVSHPCANYWDWSDDSSKVNPLQTILEEEKIRQLLIVSTIISQIQKQQKSNCSMICQKNDDYWTWTESHGEDYWNETPVPVTTGMGYWDW